MKWGAYPVISSVPSNNNGERREMEPFHEVQITLCVFNKTSDKNLKSPDAQTLNAPWSTVRHSQCSVKSKQNGIILRESYCAVCCEICIFLRQKKHFIFSVDNLVDNTRQSITFCFSLRSPLMYSQSLILMSASWWHQMSLYDDIIMSPWCQYVISPLPPCAWCPDSRTSWLSSPPWRLHYVCTASPPPWSPGDHGDQPPPPF